MTDASVKIKATLEDAEYQRDVKKLTKELDAAELKLKELNTEGVRGTSILKGMGGAALGLGGAIVTALTGGLAASPQFKAFLGELEAPLFEFSDFLGEKFQDNLNSASEAFQEFVNWFTTSDFTNTVLDDLSATFTALGDGIKFVKTKYDELPQWIKDALEGGTSESLQFLLNPVGVTGKKVGEGISEAEMSGQGDSYVDRASRGETEGTKLGGSGYVGVGLDIYYSTLPGMVAMLANKSVEETMNVIKDLWREMN